MFGLAVLFVYVFRFPFNILITWKFTMLSNDDSID